MRANTTIAAVAFIWLLTGCKKESPSSTEQPAPAASDQKLDANSAAPTPPSADPTAAAGDLSDAATPTDPSLAPTDPLAALKPTDMKDAIDRTEAQIELLGEQIAIATQTVKNAKTSEAKADAKERLEAFVSIRENLIIELKKMRQRLPPQP